MVKQIKFKDLSAWLKLAVILAWINGGLILFYFIVGLLETILKF